MANFLRNLAILAVIGVVLFIIAPDIMRQVLGIYNGLGILPVFIIILIVSALPKNSRRKRR